MRLSLQREMSLEGYKHQEDFNMLQIHYLVGVSVCSQAWLVSCLPVSLPAWAQVGVGAF